MNGEEVFMVVVAVLQTVVLMCYFVAKERGFETAE